jgi:aspartyl/asparaginyl beta-hydroxylase (cupin superfamily)
MDLKKVKPWYSYKGGIYEGEAPYFFPSEDFEWTRSLEANYGTIKAELESYLKANGSTLEPYFNYDLVGVKTAWKVGGFYFWTKRFPDACSYIPQLEKILLKIPGFVTAGISALNPNTDIKAHYGDTNTTLRIHLGLTIPSPYPVCGIEVGSEQRGWEEGKLLIFCDANLHRAWNHGNSLRYVLIIDVLKPQFLKQKRNVCSNVLSLIALQKLEYKWPLVKNLQWYLRGAIRVFLKFSIYPFL